MLKKHVNSENKKALFINSEESKQKSLFITIHSAIHNYSRFQIRSVEFKWFEAHEFQLKEKRKKRRSEVRARRAIPKRP